MILTVIDLVQHMCTHRCTSSTERTRGPEWQSETPDKFDLSDEQNNELKGCCTKHSKYDRAGTSIPKENAPSCFRVQFPFSHLLGCENMLCIQMPLDFAHLVSHRSKLREVSFWGQSR